MVNESIEYLRVARGHRKNVGSTLCVRARAHAPCGQSPEYYREDEAFNKKTSELWKPPLLVALLKRPLREMIEDKAHAHCHR